MAKSCPIQPATHPSLNFWRRWEAANTEIFGQRRGGTTLRAYFRAVTPMTEGTARGAFRPGTSAHIERRHLTESPATGDLTGLPKSGGMQGSTSINFPS